MFFRGWRADKVLGACLCTLVCKPEGLDCKYYVIEDLFGFFWPLTKFWEILGHVDLFWHFESLSKTECKMKQRLLDLGPFLGLFWDMGICNGNGMLAHGFIHV